MPVWHRHFVSRNVLSRLFPRCCAGIGFGYNVIPSGVRVGVSSFGHDTDAVGDTWKEVMVDLANVMGGGNE